MTVKIYKSKGFHKFARKEKIYDASLINTIRELEDGLYDADLGGQVYKKRLARKGQGKVGGYRTIILFKKGQRAIFAYGFSKNERANITEAETEGFKELAKALFKLTDKEINALVADGQYWAVIDEKVKENDEKI